MYGWLNGYLASPHLFVLQEVVVEKGIRGAWEMGEEIYLMDTKPDLKHCLSFLSQSIVRLLH